MSAQLKFRLSRLVIVLMAVTFTLSGCSITLPQALPEDSQACPIYFNALYSARGGYGYDPYDSQTKRHYPEVHAEIASAEVNRYLHNKDINALETAIYHANWLCTNKDVNQDGIIGWGLPFAWDAFGDGTENPAYTEYTIDTAIVIQGLLDVADAIDGTNIYNDKKEAYIKTAQEALNSFIDNLFYTNNPDGTIVFWYSSLPQDRYGIINVNAMFIGVLQRISNYAITEDSRILYRRLADEGVRYLLNVKVEKDSAWYWNYQSEPLPANFKSHRENDLIHASYVADGLLMYSNYGGRLAPEINKERILSGLKLFIEGDKVLEMFSHPELPLRSWSLGYFLYTVLKYYPHEKEMRDLVYKHIVTRQEENGFRYTEDKNSPSDFVRINVNILLGLSKYLWSHY